MAPAVDAAIDDFIEATASGQASEKRRRLDELTNALQPGDRLVVSELSRLGRSLGQIVAILDALAKAGVAFVALKENIRVEGKRDIQTKVMTTLFALFAEVERDLNLRAHPRGPRPGEVLGPEARSPEGVAGRLTAPRHQPAAAEARRAPLPFYAIFVRCVTVSDCTPRNMVLLMICRRFRKCSGS